MATSTDDRTLRTHPGTVGAASDIASDRPAARAAARISMAGLGLGALGLAAISFIVVRLLESWRISPGAVSHRVTILGQRLGYPAANLDAIVILLLAILALFATAIAIRGAVREIVASRRLRRQLERRCQRELGGALVIGDERPGAFCAGLLRPRVYLTTGALSLLDHEALAAVLAHERHHARRRDPLRLAVGRVCARSLFYVPGLSDLVRRQQTLAELSADESAINSGPGTRSALARAMLTFTDAADPSYPAGFDRDRVDHLLGEPASWRFPVLLCIASAAMIALLVAVAGLAGRVASGSASLAPPFLSQQPCIVVLALIPAVIALITARRTRRTRQSRAVPACAPERGRLSSDRGCVPPQLASRTTIHPPYRPTSTRT